MKKRLWVLPVSLALGLSLVATTPGPAEASDGWQRTVRVSSTPWGNGRGQECAYSYGAFRVKLARGCFEPSGERFWLIDLEPNRKPVVIRWRYHNKRTGVRRAGDIYNNWGAAATWTFLNKSFAEDQTLRFWVCQANLGDRTVNNCSDVQEVSHT